MVNLDRPGLQIDGLAVPRQIIGALALDLDRGILRRDLLDYAGKARQQGGNRLRRGPESSLVLTVAALGIVGIAFLAPGHRETIALAAVHHERNRLGGFPERDRQPAGSQRIEGAGVAGALGLEQPLHHRDRLRRGHADRLVEHHPAMDVALVAPRLVVLARLLAAALMLFARIVVRAFLARLGKNIFLGKCRLLGIWLLKFAINAVVVVIESSLPNLSESGARGLFAPQVFAVISLFVPLRRIVRRRENEDQVQISG